MKVLPLCKVIDLFSETLGRVIFEKMFLFFLFLLFNYKSTILFSFFLLFSMICRKQKCYFQRFCIKSLKAGNKLKRWPLCN